MPDLQRQLLAIAPWAGTCLLSLIFLANALGVLEQSIAVRELSAVGVPESLARIAVLSGRLLQLLATPCLLFPLIRPYAAFALAAFLVGATMTAHAFWNAAPEDKDRQLAGFLKNVAIIGGLFLAAGGRW